MDLHNLFEANILMPWVFIIGLLGSIGIEIMPIKVNPWRSLFKWIGKQITGGIEEKFDNKFNETFNIRSRHYDEIIEKFDMSSKQFHLVSEEIKSMKLIINENEMNRLRWEILDFADARRNGRRYSRDAYFHIMQVSDKYHRLCEENDFQNGVIDIETKYILEKYREDRDNNNFIA